MRILILNWRDPFHPKAGGAEVITMRHAVSWKHAGDTVTWFTAQYEGSRLYEEKEGVLFFRKGSEITVYFFAFFHILFNRSKYDVIVDQVHGIPFFSILYAKIPIVLFIHEVAGKIWDYMYRPPVNWIGKLLERMYIFLYRNTYVWTVSNSTASELISRGIPADRCVIIPNPVTNAPLSKPPKKNAQITCIVISRLVKMKRVEACLQAFYEIKKAYPDSVLDIIGSGDIRYIAYLKTYASTLGIESSVRWHGKVSEQKKLSLLGAAHVLLHTSVKEGWGLVVLEAGSRWTPSVVYRVPGLQDAVLDQKSGILSQEDPHKLAYSVLELLSDAKNYRNFCKNAYAWSTSFRWTEVTKASRRLLQRVV